MCSRWIDSVSNLNIEVKKAESKRKIASKCCQIFKNRYLDEFKEKLSAHGGGRTHDFRIASNENFHITFENVL